MCGQRNKAWSRGCIVFTLGWCTLWLEARTYWQRLRGTMALCPPVKTLTSMPSCSHWTSRDGNRNKLCDLDRTTHLLKVLHWTAWWRKAMGAQSLTWGAGKRETRTGHQHQHCQNLPGRTAPGQTRRGMTTFMLACCSRTRTSW